MQKEFSTDDALDNIRNTTAKAIGDLSDQLNAVVRRDESAEEQTADRAKIMKKISALGKIFYDVRLSGLLVIDPI